jgi:hypothetical protein
VRCIREAKGTGKAKGTGEAKGTGKETRLRREELVLKLQENKYKRQKEDARRQRTNKKLSTLNELQEQK